MCGKDVVCRVYERRCGVFDRVDVLYDFDILVLFQRRLKARGPVLEGADRRAVQDNDLALAAKLLRDEFAAHFTGRLVVGGDERSDIAAVGHNVKADDGDARRVCRLDSGNNRAGFDRVQEDDVNLLCDEVFHAANLLCRVQLRVADNNFNAGLFGFFLYAALHCLKEGAVERHERNADRDFVA